MRSIEFPMKSDQTVYRHANLPDTADAIRLVQVLPDLSEDGVVQCTLHDATISGSTYVCLSYRWGELREDLPIQLNGKPFYVRRNLWDFLHVARRRLTYCLLWIDAIAIDQVNVRERNHQVQQMGSIFKNAEMVITWLGDDVKAEELIRAIDTEYDRQTWSVSERFYRDKSSRGPHDTGHLFSSDSSSSSEIEAEKKHNHSIQDLHYLSPYSSDTRLWSGFGRNIYWRRAWVTQEILLAKAIFVVARDAAVDFTSLAHGYLCITRSGRHTPLEEYADLILGDDDTSSKDSPHRAKLKGRPVGDWDLITILKFLDGKCCALRRDRIYSLLALCRNGEKITVDYSLSDHEAMFQVLEACQEELCFCSPAIVARIMGIKRSRLKDEAYHRPTRCEFQLQAVPVDSTTCPSCSEEIPQSWETKSGVYFCLKSNSAACTQTHGHLLWERIREKEVGMPIADRDDFYYQTEGYKDRFHPLTNGGIEVLRNESDGIYTLRFTLSVMVDIVKDTNYLSPGTSSHTCRASSWDF